VLPELDHAPNDEVGPGGCFDFDETAQVSLEGVVNEAS
jgi:hypothetical protein